MAIWNYCFDKFTPVFEPGLAMSAGQTDFNGLKRKDRMPGRG
jgi:hypothetical protein